MKNIIKSYHEIEHALQKYSIRPLTLYSGGLDSTHLLYKLSKFSQLRPIALCIAVEEGQEDNINQIRTNAEKLGAEFIYINKIDEFINNYVVPAIHANSCYLNTFPISSSLSRPLFAKTAIEVAEKYNCEAIFHTANPSQNSLRRYNGSFKGLGFEGVYGSPLEKDYVSREEKISELIEVGIHFTEDRSISSDTNLWCREYESGYVDNPENFQWPEEHFIWSKLEDKNIEDSIISIEFQNGIPIKVNDEEKELFDIIKFLNSNVGKYGLGRYIGLEENGEGIKVQEIREMPAAFFLLEAYKRLESAIYSYEALREKQYIEQLWVKEAVEGRWYNTLMKSSSMFIKEFSNKITGTIEFKVSANNLVLTKIKATTPKYCDVRTEDVIDHFYISDKRACA